LSAVLQEFFILHLGIALGCGLDDRWFKS